MTEKVKRYIEIGELFTFDFVRNHKVEYEKLCEESKELKQQMTIEELESLKGLIPAREYCLGIMPFIRAK